MAPIIWTAEARLDLDEITDYIARDSEHYAQAVADKILKISKSIPTQPMLGRMVPEVNREDIRERFIYSYRLIYQPHEDRILILAVIHGSRLLLENIADRFPTND